MNYIIKEFQNLCPDRKCCECIAKKRNELCLELWQAPRHWNIKRIKLLLNENSGCLKWLEMVARICLQNECSSCRYMTEHGGTSTQMCSLRYCYRGPKEWKYRKEVINTKHDELDNN